MTDFEKLHFLHKMKVFKEKFTLKKNCNLRQNAITVMASANYYVTTALITYYIQLFCAGFEF